MKGLRSSLLLGVLILACTLLLSSCGGGGSNSTPVDSVAPVEPYLMFSNVQLAASGGLDAVRLFMAAGAVPGTQISRASSSGFHRAGSGPVMSVINEVIDMNSINMKESNSSSRTGFSRQAASTPPCSVENGGPDSDLTATFDSCQDGSTLLDGSMTVKYARSAQHPSSMTITMTSLHVSDAHEGFDVVFSNFSMDVTNILWTSNGISRMTIKLNGDASGRIDSIAPGPLNISCDNLTGTLSSVTGGETVSVTGNFKTSACFNDWMSILTAVPVFIPDGGGCPTDGVIICYYESNTAKIVINSDQQEDVFFDDAPTYTFGDCREAEAVCF